MASSSAGLYKSRPPEDDNFHFHPSEDDYLFIRPPGDAGKAFRFIVQLSPFHFSNHGLFIVT